MRLEFPQPLNRDWETLFTSSYRPTGTKSFRLASSQFLKPKGDEGFGNNGQNRSDEERRVFRPPPGYLFCQCDLEGAEAVAVALLCEEGPFRDLIRLKIKPHNFMCVQLFPEKFAEFADLDVIRAFTPKTFHAYHAYKDIVKLCKKLTREYDLAKRTVHGANYSMGYKTFIQTVLKATRGRVLLTPAEAKSMLNAYFLLFPEVKRYQARIEEAVKRGLPIQNLFNHVVRLVARFTTDIARLAISWGPQSTVGQCSNIAADRFQQHLYDTGEPWHLHNVTHDSILISFPEKDVDRAPNVLADCLTFRFKSPIDGWETSIGVEKQVGRNWGKYNEKENPNGLRVAA